MLHACVGAPVEYANISLKKNNAKQTKTIIMSARVPFSFQGAINWFPGHMVSAWRDLTHRLEAVHVLLEVRDARLPLSCANPKLEELAKRKTTLSRIVVLNKSDLADERFKSTVEERFRRDNVPVAFVCARERSSIAALQQLVLKVASERRRTTSSLLRCNILVAGMPNCGKSTIVNAFRALSSHTTRHTPAIVGAKPGVTRRVSSFKVADRPPTYMLDSPGLMVPSNLGTELGLKLAILDCLPTKIVPNSVLLHYILHLLNERGLHERYTKQYRMAAPTDDPRVLSAAVALHANRLGNEAELLEWTALKVATDLRTGALGKLMLEDLDSDSATASSSSTSSSVVVQ